MSIGDILDDRQTEPGPLGLRAIAIESLVAQESLLECGTAEARAGVVNLDAMSRTVAA